MPSTVEALISILRHNPTVLQQPEDFRDMLSNLQPLISESELHGLVEASKLGLADLPLADSTRCWDTVKVREFCERMAERLHFEQRFREDLARSVVETWARASGYAIARLPVIKNAIPIARVRKTITDCPDDTSAGVGMPSVPPPPQPLPVSPHLQVMQPGVVSQQPTVSPAPRIHGAVPPPSPRSHPTPPSPALAPPPAPALAPSPAPALPGPPAPRLPSPKSVTLPRSVSKVLSWILLMLISAIAGAVIGVIVYAQRNDGKLPPSLRKLWPSPTPVTTVAPAAAPSAPMPSPSPSPVSWKPSEKLRRSIMLLSGAPGTPMNWKDSNDLLNEAADGGEPLAVIERSFRLANRMIPNAYCDQRSVAVPDSSQPVWSISDDQDSVAITIVAQALLFGLGSMQQDQGRAQKLLEAAARKGYGRAMAGLGSLYVSQDGAKAAEYLIKAAGNGDSWAMALLAASYFHGLGKGLVQDKSQAEEWALRSAEANNPDGQTWVGLCRADKGADGAVDYYRKAAEAGYPDGMFLLGVSLNQYAEPQKKHEGRRWIEKAKGLQLEKASKWLVDHPYVPENQPAASGAKSPVGHGGPLWQPEGAVGRVLVVSDRVVDFDAKDSRGVLHQYRELDLGGGVRLRLVRVAGGSFDMGSRENGALRAGEFERNANEGPLHTVTLDGFWMVESEVTVEQFRCFAEAENYRTEAERNSTYDGAFVWVGGKLEQKSDASWKNPYLLSGMNSKAPVTCVSWNDAKAFCDWVSTKFGVAMRLPSEAEWEYACRAGSNDPFSFGLEISSDEVNYDGRYPYREGASGGFRSGPVAAKSLPPNRWGLYEMHGNVWEWCSDWYSESYEVSGSFNPRGPSTGIGRVLRGGGWQNGARYCRSAYRDSYGPSRRNVFTGFRPVVEIKGGATQVPLPWRPLGALGDVKVVNNRVLEFEAKDSEERRHRYRELKLGAGTFLRLVWIKGGKFDMGSPGSEPMRGDDEDLVRDIEVDGFWLGESEVTQAQWKAVMGSGSNPSTYVGEERPVEGVSWNVIMGSQPDGDAKPRAGSFMQLLSDTVGLRGKLRLPREAEWEYACRAGSVAPFYFGSRLTPSLVNYNGNFPYEGGTQGVYREETVDVKALPPNGWGLYEMHGNVSEWCNDWYEASYSALMMKNPTGPSTGTNRVMRSCSWKSKGQYCRSANRHGNLPSDNDPLNGFRVACVDAE